MLVCQSQAMLFLPYMTGHLHIIFSFKTHASEKLQAGDVFFATLCFILHLFWLGLKLQSYLRIALLWIPHFLKNKKVHISQNIRNDMNLSVHVVAK